MSRGDKVTYGGAPPKLDLNCIDNPQILGDAINYLFEVFVDVNGGGYIPDATEAAAEPQSIPTRRLVRFKTTEAMGATTANQAAAIAVDAARADIANPAIIVHDTLQQYSSAGSGKYGLAMYTEYPDDTYIFEIVRLGGEGTVTGTANDELVAVDAGDTGEHLWDKILPANQQSTGYYAANSGSLQLVYFEKVGTSPDDIRAYTSSVSTTLDYKIKASTDDTTPDFLEQKIATAFIGNDDYDGGDHQRVYFHVTTASAGGDEVIQFYTDRSEDTGKVRTSAGDNLDYLEDQFTDDLAYDATKHQLVYNDTTGAPRSTVRHFTETALLAKITTDIGGRSGDTYGSGTAAIGYLDSGTWTQITASATVYNPGASAVKVASNLASIHMPVVKVNGSWVLTNPFDPHQLTGWVYENDQSIGHDASDIPEWQDDGPCDA